VKNIAATVMRKQAGLVAVTIRFTRYSYGTGIGFAESARKLLRKLVRRSGLSANAVTTKCKPTDISKEKAMSDERTRMEDIAADVRKELDEVKLYLTCRELLAYGRNVARRVYERADKSTFDLDITKDLSGWACVNCQRLKQQLLTVNNGYHATLNEMEQLKAALAEAQAKAVQPGEIVIDGQVYQRIEA
jgi:hypothetical protein